MSKPKYFEALTTGSSSCSEHDQKGPGVYHIQKANGSKFYLAKDQIADEDKFEQVLYERKQKILCALPNCSVCGLPKVPKFDS